jgi:hypothetical protein
LSPIDLDKAFNFRNLLSSSRVCNHRHCNGRRRKFDLSTPVLVLVSSF